MASEYSEAEFGSTVEIAKTSKTGVIRIPDNDVVENFDFKKLACSDEVARDLNVGLGRSPVTARMIMRDDDGCRTGHNCQSENLPGMTENSVHRPNGHQVVTSNTPTSVKDQHHQTFTFAIEVRMAGDVRFPIGCCLIRCFALLHGIGCGTFPK